MGWLRSVVFRIALLVTSSPFSQTETLSQSLDTERVPLAHLWSATLTDCSGAAGYCRVLRADLSSAFTQAVSHICTCGFRGIPASGSGRNNFQSTNISKSPYCFSVQRLLNPVPSNTMQPLHLPVPGCLFIGLLGVCQLSAIFGPLITALSIHPGSCH